jgi:hypothetical protein
VDTRGTRRILIVAHRSVATPSLIEEVERRTRAGPCELSLLIPDASDPAIAAWTLKRARRMLSKAVGVRVGGIVAEGDDAFAGIAAALRNDTFDEIVMSTLPEPGSRWLAEDLPARVEALGVPVTVVTAAAVTT